MGSPKLDSPDLIRKWLKEEIGAYVMHDVPDSDLWKVREKARYRLGHYTNLYPEVLECLEENGINLNPDHYVHLSLGDPGMIAYTPDDRHGQQDRQIKTRFGRYLTNASGLCIPPHIIAKLGAMLRNYMEVPELFIARTEEDIEEVYENGPRSCMGGGGEAFSSSLSPVRVYATPDLGVAYCKRGDRIVARSVVRFDTMEYIGVYGDDTALEPALESHGYTIGNSLEGCRLQVLSDCAGEYIMPYLDGSANGVTLTRFEDKHYWVVGRCGDYYAQQTNGLLFDQEDMNFCDHCEESMHDDVTWISSEGRAACDSCLGEFYIWAYTGRNQEWIHSENEDFIGEYNGDSYTLNALEYHDLVIMDDGELAHLDDVSQDHVTDEYVYTVDATEFLTEDRELAYTMETQALVWSKEEEAYLLKEEAVTLSNGSDYVLPDSELLEQDNKQFKILGYVALETALLEAEVHTLRSNRKEAA